MNKRTLLAITVAVLLPVASYLIVNHYSKSAVVMPKRYFYDTVVAVTKDGKTAMDTVWHQVRPMVLTNQFGKQVTLNDSAAKLKAFGDRFNINHDTWAMLTGTKDSIYHLALKEFKANIASTDVDTNFIHTDKFFLLDKDRVVRGWYNGMDSAHLDRLINDAILLMLERDKKKKRNLFRK